MTRGFTMLCAVMLTAGGAGVGCRPKERSLSICPKMVATGKATESVTRDLPIDVWFSLVLRGFNRTAMDPGDEPRECSGQPVAVSWPTAMSGRRTPAPPQAPAPRRADRTFRVRTPDGATESGA